MCDHLKLGVGFVSVVGAAAKQTDQRLDTRIRRRRAEQR
jgi:hypothetical protein